MKRFLIILCTMALLVACFQVSVFSNEELTTYKDDKYSFTYPSSWKQGKAKDGSIILEIPGSSDGVITFAIVNDLIRFTGDLEKDEPNIKKMLTQYSGKNLSFIGEYELVRYGALQGFRAPGKWGGRQNARMLCLTDDSHMVAFVLIGERALAEEEALLSSVITFSAETTAAKNGYKTWKGEGFSIDYPEGYGTLEQAKALLFMDTTKKDQLIMVRTYKLDSDYSDAIAPGLASSKLPKSTKLKAKPEMEKVGSWSVAVIRGNTPAGPIAFYILGQGRTAMALMFIGDSTLNYAADVVASVVFN